MLAYEMFRIHFWNMKAFFFYVEAELILPPFYSFKILVMFCFSFYFAMLGTEPRPSLILSRQFTIELHPQPQDFFF
jgi:hypothetical protein